MMMFVLLLFVSLLISNNIIYDYIISIILFTIIIVMVIKRKIAHKIFNNKYDIYAKYSLQNINFNVFMSFEEQNTILNTEWVLDLEKIKKRFHANLDTK